MSDQIKRDDPYFVEVDQNGCDKCGHGKTWTVVGPDGVAASKSWDDPEDAEGLAEMLNDAFYKGAAPSEDGQP